MGKCQQCSAPTKKESAKFCSLQCKSESQKGKRSNLDPCINIKCKIDGKIFSDYENRSGTLRRYSENTLNKEFSWDDWERIVVSVKDVWKCPHCDWTTVDLENKSGWITAHLQNSHQITPEQHCEQFPNDKKLWSKYWSDVDRERYLLLSEKNRIQCLECGEYLKKISNTHLRLHNMTETEYKLKYGSNSLSSEAFREKMSYYFHLNGNPGTLFKSKYEEEICSILDSRGLTYIRRYLKFGFEIDIFIPEKNIGIEFNGLYAHSEYGGGKTKYYHRNKTEKSEQNQVHLIHIYEDQWLNKKDIVLSRLFSILHIGQRIIYGRNCKIKEIDKQTSNSFLDANHLQGKSNSSTINLGLFDGDKLVSVMTFGNQSPDKGSDSEPMIFELKRFCSEKNTTVIGAASKLFSYFERNYNPTRIISFADRSWSTKIRNTLYDKLGFEFAGVTDPNYWYLVEPNKRTHRFTYTKHNILQKFKNADPNLSEWENMVALGFDRIWDSGSLRYIKNYSGTVETVPPECDTYEPKIIMKKKRIKRHRENPKRNISDIQCEICGNEISMVGMYTHLKLQHNLSPDQYAEMYSEYRPNKLKEQKRLAEVGDHFKCLECGINMVSNKQLVQHVNKNHGPFLDYVIKYIFGGIHPTCQCGCGEKVGLKSQPPFKSDYITGHNPNGMTGKKHNQESIDKQKEKSIGRYSLPWFIERYGDEIGTKKYAERNKKLSDRNKSWYKK